MLIVDDEEAVLHFVDRVLRKAGYDTTLAPAAPEALDLSREPKHVLKLYGLDHGKSSFDKEINPVEETDYFGRKCLVARRLVRTWRTLSSRHDDSSGGLALTSLDNL